ncbi:MAG: ABC transporter ATP-binding protein, partial [Bryobacteraceae bacterium]|nr:ABC transporter ATP-binding protein [Bryobacteraceae bacterium]
MTLRRAAILLWPYFRRHRTKLWLGAVTMLARSGTAAVWPWLLKQGIDALIARQPLTAIYWFAGAIVAFTILKGVLQYWMRVLIVGFSRDIEYDLRNDLFAKLLTLSSNFYARLRTGDIMARATSDLNAVRMMCGPGLMYQTETSIVLVIALVAMFSTDWVLALCAMAPAPFVTWTVIHFGRKIHERYERIQETFSAITSRVEENLSGVRVVRAYADEPAELKRFAAMNEEYIAQNLDLTRETGLYSPLLEAIPSFSFLIVLWAGGWRVVSG